MLISCSTCGMRISKRFLVLGMPWSTYTCPGCGSVFAGTFLRVLLVSVSTGVLGYILIGVIKGKANPLLLVPTLVLALVVLLCNLPLQLKRVGGAAASSAGEPGYAIREIPHETRDDPDAEAPAPATDLDETNGSSRDGH